MFFFIFWRQFLDYLIILFLSNDFLFSLLPQFVVKICTEKCSFILLYNGLFVSENCIQCLNISFSGEGVNQSSFSLKFSQFHSYLKQQLQVQLSVDHLVGTLKKVWSTRKITIITKKTVTIELISLILLD